MIGPLGGLAAESQVQAGDSQVLEKRSVVGTRSQGSQFHPFHRCKRQRIDGDGSPGEGTLQDAQVGLGIVDRPWRPG